MTWQAIYRTSTGELASVGTVVANPLPADMAATALDGDPVGKRWNSIALAFEIPTDIAPSWTNYKFLKLLTMSERIAIREFAKTDAIAADFMDLLDKSGEVIRANPDVLAGLNYLASAGKLAAGRPTEIING